MAEAGSGAPGAAAHLSRTRGGSAPAEWVQLHPTPTTATFKRILMGEFGYVDGQGVYNAARSTETVTRQLQASVLETALNAARYEDLAEDWLAYARARELSAGLLAGAYRGLGEAEVARIAEQIFGTWRTILHATLVDFVREIAESLTASLHGGSAGFAKYIDWIVCLGIVPLLRRSPRGARKRQAEECGRDAARLSPAKRGLLARMNVAGSILRHGFDAIEAIVAGLASVTIMDYDRTRILYNFEQRRLVAVDLASGARGECLVIWPPVRCDGRVAFDSPMQRLYGEVLACHALREHTKLCQLINTVPVRVLVGRRAEEARGGVAGGAVERLLGEGEDAGAGSSAAKLIKLIVNMKGMRHIGDISETVREYLDDTAGTLLNTASVDTSQPGFGLGGGLGRRAGPSGGAQLQDAFRTSVVHNINGMLEGYVNNLFKTIDALKTSNRELAEQLRQRERDLRRTREAALASAQTEADAKAGVASSRPSASLGHEVIDIAQDMGDDTYIANSFHARYIPTNAAEIERLSKLWEQELLRCFKLTRLVNNQGQEMSICYSNSAITLLLAPYFASVLQVRNIGFLLPQQDAYKSEEELCEAVFKKTRLHAYLTELSTLFLADVRRALLEAAPAADHGERRRRGSGSPGRGDHHGERDHRRPHPGDREPRWGDRRGE
ncbi:capsid portal protein [Beluga whale alphaherpesvirus 1]|uniref:Capsid portal protein n=1 Tax=Beluga whale alphaherpesvirus 1 TaxID=1434720 RepID=A0A286MM75_9ALPH|nr:capsid portal protein [Beluga whale alphaherpesvirus 1]ASW27101.1 capsid portal protein [Beluga whale alphaherpesvirus 1]